MLSYNEDSGVYSAILENPYTKLNEKNAIMINTKNNELYEKAYEKTILK